MALIQINLLRGLIFSLRVFLFAFCFFSLTASDDGKGAYLVNLLTNPDFSADVDRDNSPDYWVKHVDTAKGFHQYSRVQIEPDPVTREPVLRLDLNGTNVAMENHDTALVRVDPTSSYHLQVSVQTADCTFRNIQTGVGIIWLNAESEVIEENWSHTRYENPDGSRTQDWHLLELDVNDVPKKAVWARVRLGLFHNPEGITGVSIKARTWFKGLSFTRRPRVLIIPEHDSKVFHNQLKHDFTFVIQGLERGDYRCHWNVTNFLGKQVDSGSYEISPRLGSREDERIVKINLDQKKGWFQLKMHLETVGETQAIIAKEKRVYGVGPAVNELGNLHFSEQLGIDLQAKKQLDTPDLIGELVEWSRTRHVTITLWSSQFDSRVPISKTFPGDLVGRMNEANVRIQAAMGYIPPEVQGEFLGSNLFSFLSSRRMNWNPLLNITGEQYAEIDSWIIGSEYDTSFIEQGTLAAPLVREVRKSLGIPGVDLSLPVGDIFTKATGKSIFPRVFNNINSYMFVQPPHSIEKDGYMSSKDFDQLLITPGEKIDEEKVFPKKYIRLQLKHPMESIEDRLDAMVFGTIHLLNQGADRVLFRLQRPERGLVDEHNDFLPEFFVFRTLTEIMAPLKILGDIDLPSKSRNLILEFEDDRYGKRLAMIVWNKQGDVTEEIFLGDQLKVLDLMGNRVPIPVTKNTNHIPVGPVPRFLVDLDEELMRTRLSVILGRPFVDSRTREIRQSIEITNFLKENLSGVLELSLPEGWEVIGSGKFAIPTMKTGDRRIVGFLIRPEAFQTTSKDVPIVLHFTFDGNTRPPMTIFKRFRFDSRSIQAKFLFTDTTQNILPVTLSVRNVGGGQVDLIAYNATLGRQEDVRFLGLLRPGDTRTVNFLVRRQDVEKERVTIGVRENGGFGRFINRHLIFSEGKLLDVE